MEFKVCYPKIELNYMIYTGDNCSEIEDFCGDSLLICENELYLETNYGDKLVFEGAYVVSNLNNSFSVLNMEEFYDMYIVGRV